MTPKACRGILRRANERGKELPEKLKRALEIQAGITLPDGKSTELEAYHINQRDEGIDLHGVSGALMATGNMQMQTFVTQENSECAEGFDGYNGDLTGAVSATLGVNCGMSTGRNGIIQPTAFAANQRDEVRAAGFCAGAAPSAGGIGYSEEIAPTLKAAESGTNMVPSVLCLNDQGGNVMDCSLDVSGALRAQEHGHQPLVYENHGLDARYTGPHEVAPTMSASYGTGGNNVPLVEQDSVLFSRKRVDVFKSDSVAATQSARQHKDATDLVYQKSVGALTTSDRKGINNQYVSQDKCVVENCRLIRRLTPLECERLQGFPDGWTDIPAASDAARYKALGNSVAIPCVDYVLHGIALALLTK